VTCAGDLEQYFWGTDQKKASRQELFDNLVHLGLTQRLSSLSSVGKGSISWVFKNVPMSFVCIKMVLVEGSAAKNDLEAALESEYKIGHAISGTEHETPDLVVLEWERSGQGICYNPVWQV